ncbi:MAG TPA: hypothetical protein VMX33_00275 [bacterium]|nr:hypothetical protein [bacterium]
MFRLLFYTGGATGSGHIALGLSVANALRRSGLRHEFQLLSVETPFADLARRQGVDVRTIPAEDEDTLGPGRWRESRLYRAIVEYNPDILVVDLFWFALDSFVRELPCRKAILIRQVDPRFFHFRVKDREIVFGPDDYDLVATVEPGFELPFPSELLEPLVMRNREEIKEAAIARAELGIEAGERACFFGFNGKEGEGVQVWKSFDYLEAEGWKVIRSDNRTGGLFPAVDWYNAFDMVVCGAGYNAFWEARYFGKEAFFAPFPRNFEDQFHRVRVNSDYVPKENGADQLVRRLLDR